MWQKLDASYRGKDFAAVELWCQAALHPFLLNGGEGAQGKFGRKLILCAIARADHDAALLAFQNMPELVQNEALTRYLMFKVSLISWDHELGCQSIEHLNKMTCSGQSQDMLYACIREAQQVGDKLCALAALKAIAGRCDSGPRLLPNFPSILRCTIRLIHMIKSQEGEQQPCPEPGLSEDTCSLFERGSL